MIVARNGESKAVIQDVDSYEFIQDVDSYEQMQETLALLKLLALGRREVEAGKTRPSSDVIAQLRERYRGRPSPSS